MGKRNENNFIFASYVRRELMGWNTIFWFVMSIIVKTKHAQNVNYNEIYHNNILYLISIYLAQIHLLLNPLYDNFNELN